MAIKDILGDFEGGQQPEYGGKEEIRQEVASRLEAYQADRPML